ncbi:MAG: GNAT family N-acetyltransferase [Microcoleaceae cyanobacterium]
MFENDKVLVERVRKQSIRQLVPLFDAYRVFYGQDSNISKAEEFLEYNIEQDLIVSLLATSIDSGEAIGFCQLFPSFSSVNLCKIYILNDLFVTTAYRRKGVGSFLIHSAILFSKQNGVNRLKLETADDNKIGQCFYESLGWNKSNFKSYCFIAE